MAIRDPRIEPVRPLPEPTQVERLGNHVFAAIGQLTAEVSSVRVDVASLRAEMRQVLTKLGLASEPPPPHRPPNDSLHRVPEDSPEDDTLVTSLKAKSRALLAEREETLAAVHSWQAYSAQMQTDKEASKARSEFWKRTAIAACVGIVVSIITAVILHAVKLK